ncbi:MAG: transposase family protein, partial [Acidimicrobiales bacterium]
MMVDLLDVNILGVDSRHRESVTVHFECQREAVGCAECGVLAQVKDRHKVTLVDLPMNGRATKVVWHKRRFFCPDALCPTGSW